MYMYLFLSILVVLGIPVIAYYTHALSRSGVLGALVVGALIYTGGGWRWFVLLLGFFASSSLLSHCWKSEKRVVGKHFEKGETRDILQVLANGATAALAALGYGLSGNDLYFWGFLGTLSTVNADTWATEIGLLSKTPPRSILSGEIVPPGTSGGLSLVGSLASWAGALFMGGVALALQPLTPHFYSPLTLVLIPGISGSLGSLLDSLLGATIQRMYSCPQCQIMTEQRLHICGTPATLVRGLPWVNNDVVNFLSALGGGGIAFLLGYLIMD